MDSSAIGSPNVTFAVAPGAEHTAHKLAQQHLQQQLQQHHIVQQMHLDQQTLPAQLLDQHAAAQKKIVLNYEDDFPTLAGHDPTGLLAHAPGVIGAGGWTGAKTQAVMQPVKRSDVTQIFHLPAEERRYREGQEHQFGEKSQEQQDCNEIMQKTGTVIELCQNKDQSITIVVTGKRTNVEEARKLIVQQLQTQARREVRIPKDHHRVLIGKEGKRLQQLEKETDCRIMIPNRNDASDVIKIIGPREGIEKAVHQIQLLSDEQSKMAQEHLMIPKVFYPWIKGPYNETVDRIQAETRARVNIPPPSALSEVIVVTGETEGVHKAAAYIRQIYEEKQRTVQTVSIQVTRSQHRFVVGPQRSGLADILRETGVSVEVPPEDAESDTIVLRGEPDKLGQALAIVYAKASSVITTEIPCPTWLHKFVIGTRGSNVRELIPEPQKVQITFEQDDSIFVQGAPEEVKRVKEALTAIVQQKQAEMASEILHVNPTFHRHIIGKNGANISRIKSETGVFVTIPPDDSRSDEIRLEGKKEGVLKAKEEIMEIAKRMENEKSRDIIIENRFHRSLIGTKGEAVRDIREKYPGVNIHFPEPTRKSDVVTLRGPKEEVDKCYKHLQNVVKELAENNFQVQVPVFKDFHKHIIGKGGANIKKIREETDTKIDLPAEGSETDVITITGKKAAAEKAKAMIHKLQEELASVVTIEVTIPHKIHSSLIGGGGRLIQSISDDCGNVQIKFPPEKSTTDKITIRGPKDGVEKAKKLLTDLAKDKELASFNAEVKAKPELFRFLIGRGGTKIKKIREANPDVRILLPRQTDQDQETIHLIGKKEDVIKAKTQIEDVLKELNQSVEIAMDVDPKHHRHFVYRGAQVLREIQEQFGGVSISFPKVNSGSTRVTLKGAKECVESAKKRIQEIVEDQEAQVTIFAPIIQRHHRQLLAGKGSKIQEIERTCNVRVKFPDRGQQNQSPEHQPSPPLYAAPVNGGGDDHTNGTHDSNPADFIGITGRIENCEKAKEMLLAEVPITETINVPFDLHRSLIGKGGVGVRRLMEDYGVTINIPAQDLHSDEIVIAGSPSNVKDAVTAIMRRVDEFEEQSRQRELKSFKVTVHVAPEYHPKLIGPKGRDINRLREKYDVQISIPTPTDEKADEIIITGYENKAVECKEEIERMIGDYTSLFTQEITLDCRIHSRLIGQKGKNIRKIMDDYKVEIRFPRHADPDPNLVIVSGRNEDAVYDCIDHLRNMEEEFLQDAIDRQQYRDPKRNLDGAGDAERSQPLEYVNAPWQSRGGGLNGLQEVPDVGNIEDFPAMGDGNGGMGNYSSTAAWGTTTRRA